MRHGGLHLTYCSNIHPGETWSDVSRVLAESLPRVRALVSTDEPFAIGLRLSAGAARELERPGALEAFRAFLQEGRYYVPTINGFPYGAFHGTRVKEQVYLPDWRSQERLEYTNRLARLLVVFAADAGISDPSISTVPGAFRSEVTSADDVRLMVARILDHAAYLERLQDQTGVCAALALEPEPACVLETTSEAVAFFRDRLFEPGAIAAASMRAGLTLTRDIVARHVGLCLDACHMAVEFEDPAEAVAMVAAAGIRICKVQLSSALRVRAGGGGPSPRELLGRFAEDTYLHQVVISGLDGLTRFVDLPQALEPSATSGDGREEWRVHFHVPIFLERMSGFETTQAFLASLIRIVAQTGVSPCLEVETYTWDVLPDEYRTTDVCTAIARELAWVQAELDRP